MTECRYQFHEGRYVCSNCGDRRARLVRRNCPRAGGSGAGDTLGRWFAALGAKKKAGCGCQTRQTLLNRLLPYDAIVWKRRLRRALQPIADLPRWLASSARSNDSNPP